MMNFFSCQKDVFHSLKFYIQQGLRVMDSTAISHCMENEMPVLVFNYKTDGNIVRAVQGEKLGTRIS